MIIKNRSSGLNFMFDVLYHEIIDKYPQARESLQKQLLQSYEQYTPSQRQALDEVFAHLFHRSFSEIFSSTH